MAHGYNPRPEQIIALDARSLGGGGLDTIDLYELGGALVRYAGSDRADWYDSLSDLAEDLGLDEADIEDLASCAVEEEG